MKTTAFKEIHFNKQNKTNIWKQLPVMKYVLTAFNETLYQNMQSSNVKTTIKW